MNERLVWVPLWNRTTAVDSPKGTIDTQHGKSKIAESVRGCQSDYTYVVNSACGGRVVIGFLMSRKWLRSEVGKSGKLACAKRYGSLRLNLMAHFHFPLSVMIITEVMGPQRHVSGNT